jgi:hypothetical protein
MNLRAMKMTKSETWKLLDKYLPFGIGIWILMASLAVGISIVLSISYFYEQSHPIKFNGQLVYGFPGPIIDIHVERPIEMPPPGGCGPDGNIGKRC